MDGSIINSMIFNQLTFASFSNHRNAFRLFWKVPFAWNYSVFPWHSAYSIECWTTKIAINQRTFIECHSSYNVIIYKYL